MALNADGFHSKSVGVGPTLEDSTISFTGDDFLNVHGTMLVVCKAQKATKKGKIEAQARWKFQFCKILPFQLCSINR